MCSLVTKKDYNKEMQSQQSFHIGYIGYAYNTIPLLNKRYPNAIEKQEEEKKKNRRFINFINAI